MIMYGLDITEINKSVDLERLVRPLMSVSRLSGALSATEGQYYRDINTGTYQLRERYELLKDVKSTHTL